MSCVADAVQFAQDITNDSNQAASKTKNAAGKISILHNQATILAFIAQSVKKTDLIP